MAITTYAKLEEVEELINAKIKKSLCDTGVLGWMPCLKSALKEYAHLASLYSAFYTNQGDWKWKSCKTLFPIPKRDEEAPKAKPVDWGKVFAPSRNHLLVASYAYFIRSEEKKKTGKTLTRYRAFLNGFYFSVYLKQFEQKLRNDLPDQEIADSFMEFFDNAQNNMYSDPDTLWSDTKRSVKRIAALMSNKNYLQNVLNTEIPEDVSVNTLTGKGFDSCLDSILHSSDSAYRDKATLILMFSCCEMHNYIYKPKNHAVDASLFSENGFPNKYWCSMEDLQLHKTFVVKLLDFFEQYETLTKMFPIAAP